MTVGGGGGGGGQPSTRFSSVSIGRAKSTEVDRERGEKEYL